MTDNPMAQGHSLKPNLAEDEARVVSEDVGSDMANPIMDLIAAGVISVIAIFVVVASLQLPVPGTAFTAPGLLPFLTAASLLVMALLLGYSAMQRRRTMPPALDRFEIPDDFKRTLVLGGIVILYVLGLQVIPVDMSFNAGGLHFVIGAFETVSLIAITGLLKLYWRAPLWACLAVTVGWIAFLSIVFRMLFQTPLP
jgi:hypothetical protein